MSCHCSLIFRTKSTITVQVKGASLVAYRMSSLVDPDTQNKGHLLSVLFPSRAMVFSEGAFLASGYISHYLEAPLFACQNGGHICGGKGATGILWVKVTGAVKWPTIYTFIQCRTPLVQKMGLPELTNKGKFP